MIADTDRPISVGLLGNAADIFPELVKRNITPDVVTDQRRHTIHSMAICHSAGAWKKLHRCVNK